MLQTHYRSPLDFSEERLAEAASALCRIENAVKNLDWLLDNAEDIPSPLDLRALIERTRAAKMGFILAMDDDFNTCKALGEVFDFIADVNAQTAGKTLSLSDVPPVRDARAFIVELMGVFGIDVEAAADAADGACAYPAEVVALAAEIAGYEGADAAEAVDALLAARADARAAKDWARADAVRDGLCGLGFVIEDTPQGADRGLRVMPDGTGSVVFQVRKTPSF
ncbi:MAG: DALR domain-containing protein [Gordonibacter pamelaeae]